MYENTNIKLNSTFNQGNRFSRKKLLLMIEAINGFFIFIN